MFNCIEVGKGGEGGGEGGGGFRVSGIRIKDKFLTIYQGSMPKD